jgi:hypothetical protein
MHPSRILHVAQDTDMHEIQNRDGHFTGFSHWLWKKKAHGYAKTENVDVVAHKYIFHDHNLVISPTRAEKIARLRRKDRTLDTT